MTYDIANASDEEIKESIQRMLTGLDVCVVHLLNSGEEGCSLSIAAIDPWLEEDINE